MFYLSIPNMKDKISKEGRHPMNANFILPSNTGPPARSPAETSKYGSWASLYKILTWSAIKQLTLHFMNGNTIQRLSFSTIGVSFVTSRRSECDAIRRRGVLGRSNCPICFELLNASWVSEPLWRLAIVPPADLS
jgi:hypothetical protein